MERTYDEKITRESTTYFVKGPVCRWNVQKMRSESSGFVSSQTVGESKYPWRATLKSMHKKFGRKIGRILRLPTTLLNTYTPKLIATILKALRELLKENDQLNAVEEHAPQYQNSLMSMIKSWKEEEDSGMMSTVGVCQKILRWLRDMKQLTWYILKVSARVVQCKSAEMRA